MSTSTSSGCPFAAEDTRTLALAAHVLCAKFELAVAVVIVDAMEVSARMTDSQCGACNRKQKGDSAYSGDLRVEPTLFAFWLRVVNSDLRRTRLRTSCGWMPHNAGFGFLDLTPSILLLRQFCD
jgi:hypothetical protein